MEGNKTAECHVQIRVEECQGEKSKARKEPDEKGERPKRPDQRLNQERARKKAVEGRERERKESQRNFIQKAVTQITS